MVVTVTELPLHRSSKVGSSGDRGAGEWDLLWVKTFSGKKFLLFTTSVTKIVLAEFPFFANGINHKVPLC